MMKQRVLGQNLTVSAIGYSLRSFVDKKGTIDAVAAVPQVQSAVQQGYTFFDAADGPDVPEQERIIGRALHDVRGQVIIATSSQRQDGELIDSIDALRQSVDDSLKRLQTTWIDLFYVRHVASRLLPEDIAGLMKDLMEAGKIRHWGLMNSSPSYIERAQSVCPITAVATPFSMMARWNEDSFILLKRLHIGLVAYDPLSLGGNSRGYLGIEEYDKKISFRLNMMKFTKSGTAQERALVKLIHTLSAEKDVTPGEIALAWVLRKKPWIVPVQSAKTDAELKETAQTADVTLSAEDMDKFAIHLGASTFDVTV